MNLVIKEQINQVLLSYYNVKEALVATDVKDAKIKAGELMESLTNIEVARMNIVQQTFYTLLLERIKFDAEYINKTENIEYQRKHFENLSNNIHVLVIRSLSNTSPVYEQFCPMAFENKGAFWLSDKPEINNPYFGDKMLKCGSVKSKF
jgi:hypothetical protein